MTRAIAIGFVIYNSEITLLERIRKVSDVGFDIYIFDNSPERAGVRNLSLEKKSIRYFTCGKNLGLGYGMSSICAQAYYEEYSGLVFFDQDSIFDENTLNFIEEYYLNHPELENSYSAVMFSAKNHEEGPDKICFKDVTLAINSGSLFFLKNLKKMNWHNESYFVDCVDYDFCFRSKKQGLKVGEYSCTPNFDHLSEQADKRYTLLGMNYSMRAYPFLRIVDTFIASSKLIVNSIFSGEFGFSAKILKLFTIYIIVQTVVRLLDFMGQKKEYNEHGD